MITWLLFGNCIFWPLTYFLLLLGHSKSVFGQSNRSNQNDYQLLTSKVIYVSLLNNRLPGINKMALNEFIRI